MNTESVDQGFELLAKSTVTREQEFREVCASVRQELEASPAGEVLFPALDRKLGESGGYAFMWMDILDIGDLCEALLSGKASEELFPNQLASVIVSLLNVWRKLRQDRVELTENEFKVLLAIKRNNRGIESISTFSGLSESVVRTTIAGLKSRNYKKSVTLLEENSEGELTTRF